MSSGKWERKGCLSAPPQALLTAMTALQAQHETEPSRVPEFLEEMIRRKPFMARAKPGKAGYTYPGDANDRLFESTYKYIGDSNCNSNCNKCDSQHEISLEKRDSDKPGIHYGVIASGNMLVKDAITRDMILKVSGEECICFRDGNG